MFDVHLGSVLVGLGKGLETDSFPREIKLKEHSEFTIRFSHLIKVAKSWGEKIFKIKYIHISDYAMVCPSFL